MSSPRVSIITPCCNGEAFLDIYFSAILAQTYENLELIFVNDGSTDGTEEIALSYGPALEGRGIVYRYLSQPNGGQASAMNRGFREMTGKYLVWPDSDDYLTPDSIAKRVDFLENHPEFAFVRSGGTFFDYGTGKDLGPVMGIADPSHQDIFLDLILEETYCACGCYMIRTELLREIYPELKIQESPVGQNWQLLIPIAGRGLCGYLPEAQYHIAQRPGSHSRQERTYHQEVQRRLGLKDVLLNAIALSGRTDRDYGAIVEGKFQKLLFQESLKYGEWEEARSYYQLLRRDGNLPPELEKQYLQAFHPVRCRLWCLKNLGIRAIRKGKRILHIS